MVLSTVLLTLGCWVMFHAWLRLRRTLDSAADPLRSVSRAAAAWIIPQLFVLPIFSRDVFAYLNQGRLVLAGEDPYTTGVSTLENWFQLGTDIVWAEDATPYGRCSSGWRRPSCGSARTSPTWRCCSSGWPVRPASCC